MPHRGGGARSTDDEDSGADSMLEVRSTHSSQSCRSWTSPYHSQASHQMALVPYDSHGSYQSCCQPYHGHHHMHPHDYPVALTSSSIEDRLRALEDDKDKLHVQVAVLSDQLNEKI